MKEKPILFSGEMVKAILDGRKTQTRRVISEKLMQCESPEDDPDLFLEWCKYGQPGDRLWVRETWRIVGWDEDGDWCIEYKDGSTRWFYSVQEVDEDASVRYWEQCTDDCIAAGIPEDDAGYFNFDDQQPCPTRWRPSIFMPYWASRIQLEIVEIRVQRLQTILGSDVLAEGVEFPDAISITRTAERWGPFRELWNSINAARGYSWDTNPWVWVIEFKRVKS